MVGTDDTRRGIGSSGVAQLSRGHGCLVLIFAFIGGLWGFLVLGLVADGLFGLLVRTLGPAVGGGLVGYIIGPSLWDGLMDWLP